MEKIVATILISTKVYLVIGFLFALVAQWRGLSKLDPETKKSPIFFRMILLPGLTLLWPIFCLPFLKQNATK